MKVALVCIAKMEELYICEWIEHYKKLGFSHIFIADNNYSGYTYPLQPVIQSYIDEGYVTIINYNDVNGKRTQINCYTTIYNNIKNEYDWIAFFDVDEFLELPQNNNISEFISRPEFNGFDVINIPWIKYDANNNFYYSQEPVQERFPTPSNKQINTIKSIVKCLDIKLRVHHHDPYNPKNLSELNRCNVLGMSRKRNGDKLNEDELLYFDDMTKIAYIKHYWCKSLEEYIMYKINRGDATRDPIDLNTQITKQSYRYHLDRFFSSNADMKNKKDIINDVINKITNDKQYIKNRKHINNLNNNENCIRMYFENGRTIYL